MSHPFRIMLFHMYSSVRHDDYVHENVVKFSADLHSNWIMKYDVCSALLFQLMKDECAAHNLLSSSKSIFWEKSVTSLMFSSRNILENYYALRGKGNPRLWNVENMLNTYIIRTIDTKWAACTKVTPVKINMWQTTRIGQILNVLSVFSAFHYDIVFLSACFFTLVKECTFSIHGISWNIFVLILFRLFNHFFLVGNPPSKRSVLSKLWNFVSLHQFVETWIYSLSLNRRIGNRLMISRETFDCGFFE